METIAVYQEEHVKVYGITEKTDLALCILCCPAQNTELWGRRIIGFEDHIKRFELVTCHSTDKNRIEMHLLFDQKFSSLLNDTLSEWVNAEQNTEFHLRQPVEVLYLFGPHFQDRFGIVNPAFKAFREHTIEILVSGCAGTSMYFVVPLNQSQSGLKILANTFLIPTTT